MATGCLADSHVSSDSGIEPHESVAAAYTREQRIKRWRREWKLALIEKINPQWRDLYDEISSNLLPVTFLSDASRTQPRP